MSWLKELLEKYPSLSAIQKELEALEERLNTAERECLRLKNENEKLRRELETLQARSAETAAVPHFAEASGLLWKSKPHGGYEAVPYCPTCKSPLADYSGSLLCLKCNWQAPLKSFEVPKVYHDLFGDK